MPREIIRKRGKRKTKATDETAAAEEAYQANFNPKPDVPQNHEQEQQQQEVLGGDGGYGRRNGRNEDGTEADWVTPGDGGMGSIRERVEGDAPWGFVDPEVKAYFKTVDERLKLFEQSGAPQGEDADEENEDRQLLIQAALAELRGKELQVSTDSDCALVVERMIWNMGDWGRRVFADSLSGNYPRLIQHRFGSHVVQTLFTLSASTVDRETRSLFPHQQSTQDPSLGTLPLMSDLILSIATELLPDLPTLIQSPFSSHPIRVLLLLLSARPIPSAADSSAGEGPTSSAIRSKRSTKFAKSHGTNHAIVSNPAEEVGERRKLGVPVEFGPKLREFWVEVREKVGGQEVRAMGVEKVAGPCMQMLIELEAENGEAEVEGSLMDSALSGLVTELQTPSETPPTRSDYLELLLRDPTGSHLLELLLLIAPPPLFSALWSTYFIGRLGKLSVHPVANFVMAKAVTRLDEPQLRGLVEEGKGDWGRAVKRARVGVLKAVVERCKAVGGGVGKDVVEAIKNAFEIKTEADQALLVPCILTLKTVNRYRVASGETLPEGTTLDDDDTANATTSTDPLDDESAWPEEERLEGEAEMTESEMYQRRRRMGQQRAQQEALAPTMQGSLLLQAMLGLGEEGGCEAVIQSLLALPFPALLTLAHSPISSRLLDVIVDSSSIPFKFTRKIIMRFDGHFFELVDHRVGSRVGEKLWEGCDGYLKEKLVKSLIPFETSLSTSQFGRFFGRRLNINLYRRRPEEWRAFQAPTVTRTATGTTVRPVPTPALTPTAAPAVASSEQPVEVVDGGKKRKRAEKPIDEIDALFAGSAIPPAPSTSIPSIASVAATSTSAPSAQDDESPEERKRRKKAKKEAKLLAAAGGPAPTEGELANGGGDLGDVMSALKASAGAGAGGEDAPKKKQRKKGKGNL